LFLRAFYQKKPLTLAPKPETKYLGTPHRFGGYTQTNAAPATNRNPARKKRWLFFFFFADFMPLDRQ
jgi:hypothetical protein